MQENRLQYDKALFQEQQEAAEKKRKDREKKEKLKLIPKPQPMANKEDVEELFEANMTDRDIPAPQWAHHLVPLLNLTCTNAVTSTKTVDKYHYDTLKATLLASCTQTCKYIIVRQRDRGIYRV